MPKLAPAQSTYGCGGRNGSAAVQPLNCVHEVAIITAGAIREENSRGFAETIVGYPATHFGHATVLVKAR